MSTIELSNAELVKATESWFPVFGHVAASALRDQLAAVPILGLPRKTERANDMHRAMRENFRRMCNQAEPLFRLEEEPEGAGLDYLICRMIPDKPFAIRWARYNGITVLRNRTWRSTTVQEEGWLFGAFDELKDGLPVATIGYELEDDYTEAAMPCWWIGRLLMLRERVEESEVVTEICVYSKPAERATGDVPPPIVVARQREDQELRELIQNAKRKSA